MFWSVSIWSQPATDDSSFEPQYSPSLAGEFEFQ